MIDHLGVSSDRTAFWTSIIAAVFSLTQCCSTMFWNSVADSFGRKTAVLAGSFLTAVASVAFGFSTNLLTALVTRSLLGFANGDVGVLRVMVAEMVPCEGLQPRAFAILPAVWLVGSSLGPALGGVLVRPHDNFPSLFGKSSLFDVYPYALPGVIGGGTCLLGVTVAFIFLKETSRTLKKSNTKRFYHFCDSVKQQWRQLRGQEYPGILTVDYSNGASDGAMAKKAKLHIAFSTSFLLHSICFDQLVPLYLNQSGHTGQYDNVAHYSTAQVGWILAFAAFMGIIFQASLFPWLSTRLGPLNCLRLSSATFPVVYCLMPLAALSKTPALQKVLIGIVISAKRICELISYPCSITLLSSLGHGEVSIGKLHAYQTSFGALANATGLVLAGLLFTWGQRWGISALPWFITAIGAGVATVPLRQLGKYQK
ncbi:major facilitator superfamily domain-containing protein [Lophiotrema nucula]|uniref:Major facilitator superfamily domain-containing protein n=1 Tax=Lophiotrema nucula TaxID=690887 RepID=A0A6A5YFQ1_9PLEO|nr:major facilitator superfamily domain-containing protein [Lophiotrema nucula]